MVAPQPFLVPLRAEMRLRPSGAGRLTKPLRSFKPSSKSNAVCTEPVTGMVYKWAALTDGRGASVSKDIGCRYRGSNGWT